jgi:hypothetical protein
LEFSLVSTPELEEELRNTGPFGDTAVSLSHVDDGKRLNLRLSGDRDSDSWGEPALQGARCRLGVPAHRREAIREVRQTDLPQARVIS